MRRKSWRVASCDRELAAQLAERFDLPPFAAYLAVARGMTDEADFAQFFSEEPMLSVDPFALPDMAQAVRRIERALEKGERIAVFGDYDTDGVTATAILYSYLEAHGADVCCLLPDRQTDGYGIGAQAVERFAAQDVKLIVTVDNGISAFEAAEKARELGVDFLITDHHRAGETLPPAVAVVNPHREDCECPFRDYAGAGVAFMLVCALEGGDYEAVLEEYADLAAIGTIGDVVTLTGENRALVRYGLCLMNERPRESVAQLLAVSGHAEKPVSAETVAFRISPRINAVGRMGSAQRALELLLCEDADLAADLAAQLDELNGKRRQVETEIFEKVCAQLAQQPSLALDAVIVAAGEGWHEGVLGIVAAKLGEKYGKPAIVLRVEDGMAKGSGRSYEGFSLFEALSGAADLLNTFGGHHGAAGLSLPAENIDALRARLNEQAADAELPPQELRIDCRLNPAGIRPELAAALDFLEPFGAGNAQPIFGLYGLQLKQISPVSEGKYLRLTAEKDGREQQIMFFGGGAAQFPYQVGDVLDVAVTLSASEYRGEPRVTLILRECKPSGTHENAVLAGERLYEAVARRRILDKQQAAQALADRELCAQVYRQWSAEKPLAFDAEALCARLTDDGSRYCAVRVAFDALCDIGVLQTDESGRVRPLKPENKRSIEDAAVIQYIQSHLQ